MTNLDERSAPALSYSAAPYVAGVYVIAEGEDGPCKIGWASDAAARLRLLQVGNPRPLRLALCLPHVQHARIERLAHWTLHAKQIRGEWFDVSEADAIAALRAAERRVNCED